MGSKLVKGTMYTQAKGRKDSPLDKNDLVRSNYIVERDFADDMNHHYKTDELYLSQFIIDEEATAKMDDDFSVIIESRKKKSQLNELEKGITLKDLLSLKGDEPEEKPKKTRRTKEQIEADKKD